MTWARRCRRLSGRVRSRNTSSYSEVALGIKRHSAYRSRSVVVEYRWHPLYGKRVPLFRRVGRGPDALVHLDVPAGMSRECPAWMCEAAVCRAMRLGSPQLSVQGLMELRRVLSESAAALPSLASSVERSSPSLPLVEESDEAKAETNTPPARAGSRKRAPNPVADGHAKRAGRGASGSADRGPRLRAGKSTRGVSSR